MRAQIVGLSSFALALGTVLFPGPVSAAGDQLGHVCTASTAIPGETVVFAQAAATNPVPAAAPASGVITQARFTAPTGLSSSFPHKLKVMRASTPAQYTVMAESAPIAVGSGITTHDVRIPVAAGDLLAIYGTAGTLVCGPTAGGDVVAHLPGDSAPGSSATYAMDANAAIPVVATVEPDGDEDGFGDVTQDQCPQSAAHQAACPVVVIDSFAAAQGNKVVVVVGTDNRAQVKVTGKAKVDGKTVKLKSRAKTVVPGSLGKFTLKLPTSLRQALADLPPSKFITVKLVATSTDVVGRKARDRTKVKVPGTR